MQRRLDRHGMEGVAPEVVVHNGPPAADEVRHLVVVGGVQADQHVEEKYHVCREIHLGLFVPGAVGADEDYVVRDLYHT